MKNIDDVHNEKVMTRDHLVFALILLVLTTLVFLYVSQKILRIVEDGCYNRLREYAEVASNEFIMSNLHYGGTLQFVADALSDRADYSTDSLQSKLNELQPFLRDQKINILLPGFVAVEVACGADDGQLVFAQHVFSVREEKVAVGFHVYKSLVNQKLTVSF